jgi:hypothetical protein
LCPDNAHRERLLNRIAAILTRCHNKGSRIYKHYGGRGISVHLPWRTDRRAFLKYLLTLPGWDVPELELDRENNDLGYQPGNLRFISKRENMFNRRTVSAMQDKINRLEKDNEYLRKEICDLLL